MNYDDYIAISSEILELESLLREIPTENVIERGSLESRLASARSLIGGLNGYQLVHKAKLTFKGRPVFDSHGIFADFASKAAGAFTDAVSAIAAGLSENLRYMGRIPDKQRNQLLITGTAIGSFGFELEVPKLNDDALVPEASGAEDALERLQELFRLAVLGTDDEVAELVDEIHPRAVTKVVEFLNYMALQDAYCGIEFKRKFFHFEDVKQLASSAKRLQADNIIEKDLPYYGEFQGILPSERTFEFKLPGQKDILKGKVGHDIDDADVLNREFLHRLVLVNLHVITVGQGRPRYSLKKLEDIHEPKSS